MSANVDSTKVSPTSCFKIEPPEAPTARRNPSSPLRLLMLYHNTPNKPSATLMIKKQATTVIIMAGTKKILFLDASFLSKCSIYMLEPIALESDLKSLASKAALVPG